MCAGYGRRRCASGDGLTIDHDYAGLRRGDLNAVACNRGNKERLCRSWRIKGKNVVNRGSTQNEVTIGVKSDLCA